MSFDVVNGNYRDVPDIGEGFGGLYTDEKSGNETWSVGYRNRVWFILVF